jgi:L-fuconolactonase
MTQPTPNRRQMIRATAGAVLAAASKKGWAGFAESDPLSILDSHVHVWDLKRFHLPWLDHNIPVLQRDYSGADYRQATEGLNITAAVYVEVNVEPAQRTDEARYATNLCRQPASPFAGAVIAADPTGPDFAKEIESFKDDPSVKGVRFLYPRDGSSNATFIKNLQLLGTQQKGFDLQLGPSLLLDAAKTAEACPDTQFILDHCGGAVPQSFRSDAKRDVADLWRRGMEQLSRRRNIVCKISGVADAALPGDETAADVTPIVRFCLDHFGPDRVLFGGNWPVCLKGSTLRHWVEVLQQIVKSSSLEDRRKLFFENAVKAYQIIDLRHRPSP